MNTDTLINNIMNEVEGLVNLIEQEEGAEFDLDELSSDEEDADFY